MADIASTLIELRELIERTQAKVNTESWDHDGYHYSKIIIIWREQRLPLSPNADAQARHR
jgi:hypothetical protein